MKALYKKIIEKLLSADVKTDFEELNLKPIQGLDIYKGQYFKPKEFELMALPAVLFEWGIAHSNVVNENKSPATITLHLMYEQIRSTASNSQQLDKALLFFDFIDQVHKAVNAIATPQTGKLQLIDEGVVDDNTMTTVYKLTYQCNYTSRASFNEDNYEYTEADAELEIGAGRIVENFDLET